VTIDIDGRPNVIICTLITGVEMLSIYADCKPSANLRKKYSEVSRT
jgi:hypothetical protein